jgi:hypothetical protein
MSVLVPVTSDEPISKNDMMSAATSRSFGVFAIRAAASAGSASVPFTR